MVASAQVSVGSLDLGITLEESYVGKQIKTVKVKSFPSLKAHWAALISVSLAPSQTPVFTLQDHGYRASASRGVPVYVLAFASTHCIYQRRDGQAELTWVAGYIPGWSPIQVLTGPGVD